MFVLNQDDEAQAKPSKTAKKPPTTKVNGNASPTKNKTAGGKVLRNKTRRAAEEDTVQSTSARIAEHQRELHNRLLTEGLAKYSEGAGGTGGKEGKGWKRFQSYKGEGALPKEVENLKVSYHFVFGLTMVLIAMFPSLLDIRGQKSTNDRPSCSRLCSCFPY